MKPGFIEDMVDEAHADPLDSKTVEFDYDEVDNRLASARRDLDETEFDRLVLALREILRWLIHADKVSPRSQLLIGRRALALAWTIDPSLIEGSPSLSQLARDLNCNKVAMSIHAASAHRTYGIRNRAQAHGWNFKPTLPAQKKGNDEPDEL